MRSRLTFTVRSEDSPGVNTRSCTLVPAGPLMRLVETSLFTPAIGRPSTARMKSPVWMWASLAGEPSNTRSTFSPRRSCSTFMPTPSKCPLTSSSNWRASFAVR